MPHSLLWGYLLIALAFILVITGTITWYKVANNATSDGIHIVETHSWAEGALDLQGLFTMADAVVVGKIGKVLEVNESFSFDSPLGKQYTYLTDYEFIVETDLKAKVKSDNILIRQNGKAGVEQFEDDPLFQPGDSYLLFLREWGPGEYNVIGGPQGRFKIVNEKIYSINYLYPKNNILLPGGTQSNGMNKAEFLQMLTNFSK